MLSYLKLTNVGPSPEMEIHFKPRMSFLTGDNGLGKTFLLDMSVTTAFHVPTQVACSYFSMP